MKYFFASICFFLLFFLAGFYSYYLYKYPTMPNIQHFSEHYPENLIVKLGAHLFTPDKSAQHFLNFKPKKQKGIIRIGAFGDSFTFGEEAQETAAYPYQLQKLFDKRSSLQNIEVLNFGVSGAGLQEQFFLWEEYSKKYQLDYILLGPRGFYSDRDMTFTKGWGLIKHYPRNRLILDKNGKLREVHIRGESLTERYRNYYKLFPTKTALLYDKRPFKIWEYFVPFLRDKIQNPFYYTKISSAEESSAIHKILLERMIKAFPKKILFLTDLSIIHKNYLSLKKFYNLNFIPETDNFYKVVEHKSSLGNEWISRIYFKALIGEKEFSLKKIECSFKENKKLQAKPLDFFDKDSLNLVNKISIVGGEGPPLYNFKLNNWEHRSYLEDKAKNTKNFITLSNKTDFLRTPFIPLSTELKEGMKLYIQLDKQKKFYLGSIKALDSRNKFFNLYLEDLKTAMNTNKGYLYSYLDWESLSQKLLDEKIDGLESIKSLGLFLEDQKLGYFTPIRFSWLEKTYLKLVYLEEKTYLMMGEDSFVKEKDFPEKFSVFMQYHRSDGKILKSLIPDWICKKNKKLIQLELPYFEPLNL